MEPPNLACQLSPSSFLSSLGLARGVVVTVGGGGNILPIEGLRPVWLSPFPVWALWGMASSLSQPASWNVTGGFCHFLVWAGPASLWGFCISKSSEFLNSYAFPSALTAEDSFGRRFQGLYIVYQRRLEKRSAAVPLPPPSSPHFFPQSQGKESKPGENSPATFGRLGVARVQWIRPTTTACIHNAYVCIDCSGGNPSKFKESFSQVSEQRLVTSVPLAAYFSGAQSSEFQGKVPPHPPSYSTLLL